MSGIYFHIPFCKARCSYCDFYKTTSLSKIDELVKALKHELWIQRDYLDDQNIQTIYFGGGTPSLLSTIQIEELMTTCNSIFNVDSKAEITLEGNPDDLNIDYLDDLKQVGINRLSIGIQSLSNSDLKLMNRRHNSEQAIGAITNAQQVGFDNISIDLIYGVPSLTQKQWSDNLNRIFDLDIQHISAYHLTYHKGTTLWNDLRTGTIKEIDERASLNQFNELIQKCKVNGFEQYEISNFCKDNKISRHNSSYWNQTEYLGVGPSAHSYNKVSRQWNVSDLKHYLNKLSKAEIPFDKENLTVKDIYNDYVITALRTKWGISTDKVKSDFGIEYFDHVKQIAEKYLDLNKIIFRDNNIVLAENGLFISDAIMTEFMK